MSYIPTGKIKKVTEHLVESGIPYIQALALAQLFNVIYTHPEDVEKG